MADLGRANDINEESKESARDMLVKQYKQVFTTPAGEAVLADLKTAFWRGSVYVPQLPQPFDTFFREGQRAVVDSILYLVNDAEVDVKQQEDADE